MKKRTLYLLCFLATFYFFDGCKRSADRRYIQIKGSDTMVNAAQLLSEKFMQQYQDIFVAITGGGSGVGIASLINETCDIATASREMKPKEIEMARKRGGNPVEIVVAYDGIAVIVNLKNPVEQLTMKDLNRIFTGQAGNWKEFGGPDLPIVLLSREVSSGTHIYFKEEVIREGKRDSTAEFSPDALLLTSSQTIVEEVANNQAAIGYFGMGYISDRAKTLKVGSDGVHFYAPDIKNVLSKQYPLSRPLYFYTNGDPVGIVKQFVDFTLSPEGQRQFAETGFVPREALSE
ncbi:MAG: phosphate ABC transporter substrate-binding protein [Planctomycetaceae bacterium]|nr:phosphate ABC transporter substrate-binding protein [Planctomycetaceae bacterium]